MTRQELDALAAQCISGLSRCTPNGIEKLKRLHAGTIQMIRWYKQNMIRLCNGSVPSVNLLLAAIAEIQYQPYFCSPPHYPPTKLWEDMPL